MSFPVYAQRITLDINTYIKTTDILLGECNVFVI